MYRSDLVSRIVCLCVPTYKRSYKRALIFPNAANQTTHTTTITPLSSLINDARSQSILQSALIIHGIVLVSVLT